MAVSYMYLWYIFFERNIEKLAEKAGITQYTTEKLDKNKSVGTESIGKIWRVLSCDADDIIKFRQN